MSEDTRSTGDRTHRYLCSNCEEMWEMDDLPMACPYCGNDVIAGYREIREVAVEPDDEEKGRLPTFEELVA